jgi:hypothetical protein
MSKESEAKAKKKARAAWLSFATSIIILAGSGLGWWYDHNKAEIEISNLNNQKQEMLGQSNSARNKIDSLNNILGIKNLETKKNIDTLNILKQKKDFLQAQIDSISDTTSAEREILLDSLNILNLRIDSLEVEKLQLEKITDSLVQSKTAIDMVYMRKYASVISYIDSFTLPFQLQNLTIMPKILDRKKRFVQAKSKNGRYDRDDFSKIDCTVKAKASNIFYSKVIPDSIKEKKFKPINIYVAFSTSDDITRNKIYNPKTTYINGNAIVYSQSEQLDLSKGEITISLDNPIVGGRGDVSYIFAFFTNNSVEPFYTESFLTTK